MARSALATQASISATSFLCSMLGTSSITNDVGSTLDESTSTSLPWIDDLHNTISMMYLGGACCPGIRHSVVQMHPDATIENPLVAYSGIAEIGRAFRARNVFSRDDTTSLLEFLYVQASEDSIVGSKQNYHEKCSPPSIYVVYRLQKSYGSYFTINTMLKVTVQCQISQCRKILFQLPERKANVLATSGLTKNVVGGFNIVGSGAAYYLARDVWQRWFSKASSRSEQTVLPESMRDPSFVAEIVKIEECWNEVELVQPFHISRRINGLLIGTLTYMLSLVA